MKKFEVNPKEELLKEEQYHGGLESIYRNRGDIYIAVAMIVIGGFFYHISADVKAFLALVGLTAIVVIACLVHFIVSYLGAKKEDGKEKYYITNVRVVIADENDAIKKELVNSKIKKVELDKRVMGGSTIFINKKEDQSRKGKAKQFRSKKTVYTSDTFILDHIKGGSEVLHLLETQISK